jgi:hypothetical protein
LIEIGSIRGALDGREIRWWDPLVVDIIEIDVLEEEMSLDIFSVRLASTKSSSGVSCQELEYQHSGEIVSVENLHAGGARLHLEAW